MAYARSRRSSGGRAGGYSRSSRRAPVRNSGYRPRRSSSARARPASRRGATSARQQTVRIVIENPASPSAGRAVPSLFQRALNPVPGVAERGPRKAKL